MPPEATSYRSVLTDDDQAWSSLHLLVQDLARDEVSENVRSALRLGRMTALRKKDSDKMKDTEKKKPDGSGLSPGELRKAMKFMKELDSQDRDGNAQLPEETTPIRLLPKGFSLRSSCVWKHLSYQWTFLEMSR